MNDNLNFQCPIPQDTGKYVLLGHGSGGQLTHEILSKSILPYLDNDYLNSYSDQANLGFLDGNVQFSTDSFVVSPLFFPGGDIGKIAFCGTCNDLAVGGAKPLYLSLSLIIEEGFSIYQLEKIMASIGTMAKEHNVKIVCGDTKVVEKNKADGLYINTSGIGISDNVWQLSTDNIKAGDSVIITGPIGDHGMTIMAERENLNFRSDLKSDCAYLWDTIDHCHPFAQNIRYITDPTRGGLATSLVEIVEHQSFSIRIFEDDLPIRSEVLGGCELFGLEPYYLACEGRAIIIVDGQYRDEFMAHLQNHHQGQHASIIGEVQDSYSGTLILQTEFGTDRVLRRLAGDQLPRIC